MPYSLFLRKHVDKIFEKIAKKDPPQEKALKSKLAQILEDPYRFKPLKAPLQNKRRVHVFGSFVLVYSIDDSNKTVIVEDYDHHDNIYR
ncbi:MAG: type II toxin-antitoxin system RelE/ParE family toxin [Candidatus Diapherotrites archaeon]|uniref:Type II toxin-antitoxin system RelE/ParE family toxin n=1 Tax=Candidatus Iainarchaeum sp. TaxID=3101447 RepID=A0A8T4LAZ4_9ARCH|nr:type II toxin-antitoxin system RelE/ParE family toxin [Candidatus Diapherotrites archaeon]